jgi:uncharacterized protein (DUF952 family)
VRVNDHVYRICEFDEWQASQAQGELVWSDLDRRDGFIHLSSARQVEATLARHFVGRADLWVLTIACDRLVDGSLRFESPRERSRSAEQFPHFYGRIDLEAIVGSEPLTLAADGSHPLPAAIRTASLAERDDLDTIAVRVAWDERRRLAMIEYPKPARIEDEAGIYAWEALLEHRVSRVVERFGGKVPAVVGLDNLWIAPKLERRYAELADKVISRWFSEVARWSSEAGRRSFFVRANGARSLPTTIFDRREDAIAFVLARARAESP